MDSTFRLAAGGPTRATVVANVAVFQATWFSAIFAAAHCIPAWGILCVLCAVAWHVGLARRSAREAMLVGIACLIGFALETMNIALGHVSFPSCGAGDARLAPAWLVAMWGLFAICLNVSLRWLRGRWWLAAALGAVGGPLSFASGVKLGAAHFVDAVPALLTIAASWCVALPLLVWLSMRFDGVSHIEARNRAARGTS
ncbi:DUF2878 domain-containing protein [Variovorax sp. GT1P44]|uniref:DUF2878 domain-containing protein n=1 Tax=Variovorax sp. GT1P44 TaxID=3443742 RepID=UPI003F45FDFE